MRPTATLWRLLDRSCSTWTRFPKRLLHPSCSLITIYPQNVNGSLRLSYLSKSPFDDDDDRNMDSEMHEENYAHSLLEDAPLTDDLPHSQGPSILSPIHVWKSWTDLILLRHDTPDNNITLPQIERLIQWWARQRPFTSEAAACTWKLLDVLNSNVSPTPYDSVKEHAVKQNLLNLVLDHWRLSSLMSDVIVPYDVYAVWNRLLERHAYCMDIRTYAIILFAVSRHEYDPNPLQRRYPNGSIDFAHSVVQHYLNRRATGLTTESENASVLVLWNSFLTVIAKQGCGANIGEQAELILRQMIDDLALISMEPDEISYACVLEAWSNAANLNPRAGSCAERLLREMVRNLGGSSISRRSGGDDDGSLQTSKCSIEKAASTCYLHVLRALSKSATPDGADRADHILQGMIRSFLIQMHGSNDGYLDSSVVASSKDEVYPNIKPTRHWFSAVMSGYADRGRLTDVERLLRTMQSLYETSRGDPLLCPTTATFNSILEAYAQQGTPESAASAEQLLEKLHNDSLKADTSNVTSTDSRSLTKIVLIDTRSVNTCLHAWAQSGAPDAVERAEALLLKASQWKGVNPDPYSYTTVMKAWTKSSRPDAAKQCEGILWSMWERYHQFSNSEAAPLPIKPNDVTYATAIYCWSMETRIPEAPLHAENLYKDMLERYQSGDHSLKPSLTIYVSLISAWAHSCLKGSEIRAQLYFDRLRGHYLAGDDSLRPTDKVYNALISCKKIRGDGEGAEMILNYMFDDYLNYGNKGALPNRTIFHNVMSAWANSNDPNSFQRIEMLLKRMYQEYKARKWDCKPNAVSYTIVLNCFAKRGTRDAAIRAESVLQHMYDLSVVDSSVKPCQFSCGTVIRAWANTINVGDAPFRAQAIFDDMIRRSEPPYGDINLRPNSFAYNSLLTTWAKSARADSGEKALAILQGMEHRHSMDQTFDSPSSYHYTAVISAFANKRDVAGAENVLQHMIERRVPPHASTLNALMKAYSNAIDVPDSLERAEKLLRSMETDFSISPDAFSYTTFMLCIQRGRHPDAFQRARKVLDEWIHSFSYRNEGRATKMTPSVVTFGILLIALKESNDKKLNKIKELESILEMMKQYRIEPSPSMQKDIMKIRLSNAAVVAPFQQGQTVNLAPPSPTP
jgi:pentatricopeptide repeat protein